MVEGCERLLTVRTVMGAEMVLASEKRWNVYGIGRVRVLFIKLLETHQSHYVHRQLRA